MDDISDEDELFLDAVDHIVLKALTAIGDDPTARFAFFRRLLLVVLDVSGSSPPDEGETISPARKS